MKITDDFLPDDQFASLQEILLGADFPWFYNDKKVSNSVAGNYQFIHNFARPDGSTSQSFFLLEPLLNIIQPKELLRAKANLEPKNASQSEGGWHTDFDDGEGVTTATFYINDNNGHTLFEDGTRVDSISNRFASFDCMTRHTGVSQTDTNIRVVLNLNYRA